MLHLSWFSFICIALIYFLKEMVLHRFLSEFWNGDLASLIYNRDYNVVHMDKNLCGVPGTTFSYHQLFSNYINLGGKT